MSRVTIFQRTDIVVFCEVLADLPLGTLSERKIITDFVERLVLKRMVIGSDRGGFDFVVDIYGLRARAAGLSVFFGVSIGAGVAVSISLSLSPAQ